MESRVRRIHQGRLLFIRFCFCWIRFIITETRFLAYKRLYDLYVKGHMLIFAYSSCFDLYKRYFDFLIQVTFWFLHRSPFLIFAHRSVFIVCIQVVFDLYIRYFIFHEGHYLNFCCIKVFCCFWRTRSLAHFCIQGAVTLASTRIR